uniref:JmjC domain-containing protein n=1 Tax=Panagrolaimus superbus TaxID=310955 RepID=A0A914XXI5_9BILA
MSNLNHELKPFVLRKFAHNKGYDPIKWSLDDFPKWLKKDVIRLRVASTSHEQGKIMFEKMCLSVILKPQQFVNWLKDDYVIPYEHGNIVPSTHWAYYDYKPAAENFTQEFTEALSFDKLGIKGEFNDETIWIGSPGAYTPCHYDSYGYNLHLQLKGTKRWIVFPPETELSPSRIPYEESTIYSLFDITGGQLPSTGPQNCYCIYLEEGDLLFIPPKWWHSVQCFKGDIKNGGVFSVNKWFPIESDEKEKKKECIVGCLTSLINPEYFEDDKEEQFTNLESIISEVFQMQQSLDLEEVPLNKKSRMEDESKYGESKMMKFYNEYLPVAEKLPQMSFDELKREMSSNHYKIFDKKTTVTDKEFMMSPIVIPSSEDVLLYPNNIRKMLNAFTNDSTLEHVIKLMQNEDI